MMKEIKSLFVEIRRRNFPYAARCSPHFLSSDCYNWDEIEKAVCDLIERHPTAVQMDANSKCNHEYRPIKFVCDKCGQKFCI